MDVIGQNYLGLSKGLKAELDRREKFEKAIFDILELANSVRILHDKNDIEASTYRLESFFEQLVLFNEMFVS